MPERSPQWYDDEAGPLVRLYAVTSGRARSSSDAFDLMAVVQANPTVPAESTFTPEMSRIMRICRHRPQTVADIAADSELPIGVVRVLLGDLLDSGHIYVGRPVRAAALPDPQILREVIDGLRAL
jgi:hypothetical protein